MLLLSFTLVLAVDSLQRVTLASIRWGLLYGVSLTLARALGEFGAVLGGG